ncbi:uncharacterized protein TNCV_1151321 [Trichonephila clavipes]|nr:uncharacterized protein TNCV_1151321 [Trichonephila clavipes]
MGIHFRRKTDFFPEEDTTKSYSAFEPETTRLHADGHSHHTGWAAWHVFANDTSVCVYTNADVPLVAVKSLKTLRLSLITFFLPSCSFRSYYPYGLNVIWKGESVLLTFKQKSEDSLYIPNFDKSIDNSNNIGLARISRAKRRKRATRDMSTPKNSMLELAVKFDDNYNTGLIKSFYVWHE